MAANPKKRKASSQTSQNTLKCSGQKQFYGNYENYYSRRNPLPRILSLLKSFESSSHWSWSGKRVLDYGCNCGVATLALLEYIVTSSNTNTLKEDDEILNKNSSLVEITGVDRDGSLIARANILLEEKIRLFSSKLHPDAIDRELITALQTMRFRVSDWAADSSGDSLLEETFDVVLLFGVLKWIHLAQGDRGLRSFLQLIHRCLVPDGILVVELQNSRSYARAKKKCQDPSLPPNNSKELTIDLVRDLRQILEAIGFVFMECISYSQDQQHFKRDLWKFRRLN